MLGLELVTPLTCMRYKSEFHFWLRIHLLFFFLSLNCVLFFFQAPATALLVLETLKKSVKISV